MKIKKLQLRDFKRFTDLTINLGDSPKKIVALVGPNGCGKSSIFDAFEEFSSQYKGRGGKNASYYKKSIFKVGNSDQSYSWNNHVSITSDQSTYSKTSFYIRSAYRFTPRLNVGQIKKLSDVETDDKRPQYLVDSDSRLQDNYERLLGKFYDDVYDRDITGQKWAEDNINGINEVLKEILDIEVVFLGNPVKGEGSLYFKKGTSEKFPYENLSAGEKEVIDLVLDVYVKKDTYANSIICIDEPELHISTSIQRKLLIEIEKLIPDTCQLWIATHSIGFLRALQEELKDKTQVINFYEQDLDNTTTLYSIIGTREEWKMIFRVALDDLSGLISPKTIIYCEGEKEPNGEGLEQGLDATIYNLIFSNKYPDILFISSGGGSEPRQYSEIAIKVLQKSFLETNLLLLKDRGGKDKMLNDQERQDQLTNNQNKRILVRREVENYIFDPEVLKKYKPDLDVALIYPEGFDYKSEYLKPKYQIIKQSLCLGCDNKTMMIRLSELVTEDTEIYQELEKIIFQK